jgi:preprotein translocase subunit SecD
MLKSIPFRIVVIVALLIIGAIYLRPTLRYEQLSKEETQKLYELNALTNIPLANLGIDIYRDDVDLKGEVNDSGIDEAKKVQARKVIDYLRGPFREKIKYNRAQAIKRGLDLQGGMYLVLEVDVVKLVENTARNKDERFEAIIAELRDRARAGNVDILEVLQEICRRRSISLSTYWGEAGQTDESIRKDLQTSGDDAIDRSLEILRNRIDQFGVSEPTISKMGSRRIAIELPGVRDPARARELIGRTALLEFKLLIEPERSQEVLLKIDNIVKASMGIDTTTAPTDSAALAQAKVETTAADTAKTDTGAAAVKAEELFAEAGTKTEELDSATLRNPFLSLLLGGRGDIIVPAKNKSKVSRYIASREVQRAIPSDVQFLWSNAAEQRSQTEESYWTLYLVKKEAEQTGATLADARSTIGSGYEPDQAGKPIVEMEMTRPGARIFSRVTGANVGKRLSIVLDDKVHSAPQIRGKIPGGNAVITGMRDMEEARDLAIVLRAGALPAPVQVIEERSVGPSLGRDSVEAGQLCLILSFSAVILFMIWYYRASGIIADLAMIFNVFLLMAALALFQFTLTMPGIAGIILTIGLAVDANVLIFERIREELRLGKTVRAAIDTGFERALRTIIDSNTTTAIAGVVLLIYGTGAIKGFALTLTVGIIINMFTAIFLTRLIYNIATHKRQLKTLSV